MADNIKWIKWKIQEPRVETIEELDKNHWVKFARMRDREADKIQMSYATDLIEVGTDDSPEPVVERNASIWQIESDTDQRKIHEFNVMEYKNDKKSIFWALSKS